MSLQTRLDTLEPVDTWPALLVAAEERYYDGLSLALDDRRAGAIYLLGYVVEMLLKAAFFQIKRVPGPHNLWSPLTPGRADSPFDVARAHAGWSGRPSLHNLEAWSRLIITERGVSGPALDPSTAAVIEFHVRMVDMHWRETLRYKSMRATEAEITDVFTSTDWLFRNRSSLWS